MPDPNKNLPSLAALVAAVPELYQPVFGRAEFDTQAGATFFVAAYAVV